ncbi:MAG: YqgE/AlgH family protein [Pseudomonadota bacterium]
MPCLKDSMFGDSLIYICAHSKDGCMGFIVNKPHEMVLDELISRVDVSSPALAARTQPLDLTAKDRQLRVGGPVDENRGFILHSGDYEAESTIVINSDVSLTSTISALEDVAEYRGPRDSVISLGYSSWGANQLEDELSKNFWLTLDGPKDLIFDQQLETKYDSALAMIGITSKAAFVAEPGHA